MAAKPSAWIATTQKSVIRVRWGLRCAATPGTRRCDMGEYYYSLPGQEKDVPEKDVWLWLQGREMAREMGG
ncbi:MAG: hypothetical protein WD851_19745 [Pirellulales bacterium]